MGADSDGPAEFDLRVSGTDGGAVPPHPRLVPIKWSTIAFGRRFYLCYSMGRGEDRYFISKGFRRAIESFPLSDEGWAEAWVRFVELEPNRSQDYAAELKRNAAQHRSQTYLILGFKAVYMGGLPAFPNPQSGVLRLSETQLGLATDESETAVIPLADMRSVDVSSSTVSKSKVAATLAFGVLGGVGSRGTKTEVAIVVHLKSGDSAYYVIPDSLDGPLTIRGKMGPVLQRAGVPFVDDVSSSSPPPALDVADQLRKLATLRDEGILTSEEFDAAKAKLLA